MDGFDHFKRTYFDEVDDESLTRFAKRAYPFVVSETREDRVRLPYTFTAVFDMADDENLHVEMARSEGFFDEDTPDEVVEEALDRVERARRWAEKMDSQYNYRLQVDLPEFDFELAAETALDELADFAEKSHDGEAIQGEIYETTRRHDIEMSDFFAASYRLFFDAEQGPRLGGFLDKLERDFVVTRFQCEDWLLALILNFASLAFARSPSVLLDGVYHNHADDDESWVDTFVAHINGVLVPE